MVMLSLRRMLDYIDMQRPRDRRASSTGAGNVGALLRRHRTRLARLRTTTMTRTTARTNKAISLLLSNRKYTLKQLRGCARSWKRYAYAYILSMSHTYTCTVRPSPCMHDESEDLHPLASKMCVCVSCISMFRVSSPVSSHVSGVARELANTVGAGCKTRVRNGLFLRS